MKECSQFHKNQSKCWAKEDGGGGTFRSVKEGERDTYWIQCKVCLALLYHPPKSATNKLNRHSEKCSDNAAQSHGVNAAAPGPSPLLSKKQFTSSSVDYVVASGVSFNQLKGPEYECLIDDAMALARQDKSLQAKDIIPDPSTVSRNISLKADRARLEIFPDVCKRAY